MDACGVEILPALEMMSFYEYQKFQESYLEEGHHLKLAWRPELSLKACHVLEFKGVPEVELSWRQTSKEEFFLDSLFLWKLLYASMFIGENLQVSYGIQNYQWTEAESFSPSNVFFSSSVPSMFFYETGQELLKITWSFNESFLGDSSFTVLHETKERYLEDQEKRNVMLWDITTKYLRIVPTLSFSSHQKPLYGGLVVFPFFDSFFLYHDFVFTKAKLEPLPFSPTHDILGQKSSLRVTSGLRYVTETLKTFRIEHLLDDSSEKKKQYLYFSSHLPELGNSKSWTLTFWEMYSFQDSSNFGRASLEYLSEEGLHIEMALRGSLDEKKKELSWVEKYGFELGMMKKW